MRKMKVSKDRSKNHPKAIISLVLLLCLCCLSSLGISTLWAGEVSPEKGRDPSFATCGNPHALLPGDVLEIKVYRQKELNMMVRVGADGYIRYPFCGRVLAQGKTPDQLATIIIKGLKAARYEDPQVVVFLKEYVPRMVYVFGEIHNAALGGRSALEIPPGGTMTALQAISAAGGVTEKADLQNITVLRRDSKGRQQWIKLDARNMSSPEKSGKDIMLMPNDIVIIPPQRQIFVYGRVNKPGGFFIPHGDKLTVSRALAMAGGTERPASEEKLKVIRGDKVMDVDLSKMVEDGKVEADLTLQPGDVIYVPQSRW